MLSYLYSIVAVFRGQYEPRQNAGQIQTAEIPHQVPEDDRVLAEELLSVDNLNENIINRVTHCTKIKP